MVKIILEKFNFTIWLAEINSYVPGLTADGAFLMFFIDKILTLSIVFYVVYCFYRFFIKKKG